MTAWRYSAVFEAAGTVEAGSAGEAEEAARIDALERIGAGSYRVVSAIAVEEVTTDA